MPAAKASLNDSANGSKAFIKTPFILSIATFILSWVSSRSWAANALAELAKSASDKESM